MFLLVNWDVKQGADYVHIRLKVAGKQIFGLCDFCLKSFCSRLQC